MLATVFITISGRKAKPSRENRCRTKVCMDKKPPPSEMDWSKAFHATETSQTVWLNKKLVSTQRMPKGFSPKTVLNLKVINWATKLPTCAGRNSENFSHQSSTVPRTLCSAFGNSQLSAAIVLGIT